MSIADLVAEAVKDFGRSVHVGKLRLDEGSANSQTANLPLRADTLWNTVVRHFTKMYAPDNKVVEYINMLPKETREAWKRVDDTIKKTCSAVAHDINENSVPRKRRGPTQFSNEGPSSGEPEGETTLENALHAAGCSTNVFVLSPPAGSLEEGRNQGNSLQDRRVRTYFLPPFRVLH